MDMSNANISLTLPIAFSDGLYLDPKAARMAGESLAGQYCFAEPYPHIVIDNFLPIELAEEILANFPHEPTEGDRYSESGYAGLHKRQIFPIDCNGRVREVFAFLNSSPVLQFLEGLSAIDGLIADPYFIGGGLHETRKNGRLGIHADFRINEQLHLARRMNMLIYLNKDWQEEYGGHLEIWDRAMSQMCRKIAPIFNRCVIFNTEADTYHGHPDPLATPDGMSRKSVALYYYTASKHIYDETPAHTTMYAARPTDSAADKRQAFMLSVQNYLKDWLPPAVIRALSKLRKTLKPGRR